jgi:hypothetical protein
MKGSPTRLVLVFNWQNDQARVLLAHVDPVGAGIVSDEMHSLDKIVELGYIVQTFKSFNWQYTKIANVDEGLNLVYEMVVNDIIRGMNKGAAGLAIMVPDGVDPKDPKFIASMNHLVDRLEKAKEADSKNIMLDIESGESLFLCVDSEPFRDGTIIKLTSKVNAAGMVTFKCLGQKDTGLTKITDDKVPVSKFQEIVADIEKRILEPCGSKWKR